MSRHGVVVCRECRHEVELEQLIDENVRCKNCHAIYNASEVPAMKELKAKIDAAKKRLDEVYDAPAPKNR